jgi:hypothetical protein
MHTRGLKTVSATEDLSQASEASIEIETEPKKKYKKGQKVLIKEKIVIVKVLWIDVDITRSEILKGFVINYRECFKFQFRLE